MARHPKREFLEDVGALHEHPERVRAELFERYRFFDPLDKVQVKYEMLRACGLESRSVAAAAREFGFSRETYYVTLAAFREYGVVGLADGKRGRSGPLKLTTDATAWVLEQHRRHPNASGREIAEQLAKVLGIEVHRRTIERVLGPSGKKNG
jgi:transposase